MPPTIWARGPEWGLEGDLHPPRWRSGRRPTAILPGMRPGRLHLLPGRSLSLGAQGGNRAQRCAGGPRVTGRLRKARRPSLRPRRYRQGDALEQRPASANRVSPLSRPSASAHGSLLAPAPGKLSPPMEPGIRRSVGRVCSPRKSGPPELLPGGGAQPWRMGSALGEWDLL